MAEYTQNWRACPHGTVARPPNAYYVPPGGADPGHCWLCHSGCTVLCVLKKLGARVTADNVEAVINGSALVDWGKARLVPKARLAIGVIAKVADHSHWVLIDGGIDGAWHVHDPGAAANRAPGVTKANEWFAGAGHMDG